MLKSEEETDVPVTWEDQQKINSFSKYVSRLEKRETELVKKTQEREYLEDLETELELSDEDCPLPYRVGDSFVNMSLEKVQYSLSVEKEAVENDVKHLKGQIESIRSEMDGLKVYLYTKFGKSINLER